MAGSIRRRGANTWELTVDLGRDPVTGRRQRRFESFNGTKKAAQQRLTELLSTRDRGIDIQPTKVTLAEYLARWLTDYAAVSVAPSTLARYRIAIDKHISAHLGSRLLTELRPMDIQRLHSTCLGEKLSPRTVVQHHRIVREALKHAVLWQLIPANPADAISPPRYERKEMSVLDGSGVLRLLEMAEGSFLHPIIFLAVDSGARVGELLGLRWSDIDFEGRTLRIVRTVQRIPKEGIAFRSTKTAKSRRTIPFSHATCEILQAHRDRQDDFRLAQGASYFDQELVFAQAHGGPFEPVQISHAFGKLIRGGDLPRLRFHDLRHTAATIMLAK
ncbi:MAG: site-specific integrase, partial [Dehalococcoidia bacterium]|nr:site-specific integrase [Dehalococcoidia bacterium]